jgi:hypothetical protein
VKWVAWDPLAFAAVFGFMAGLLYVREEAPRWCGFFAAATVVFLTAGVRPLLKLAHTQLTPGLSALIVMVGVVGAVLMFYLVVFKGHHDKPLIKRRGGQGAAAGGQPGGGKSRNKKTPHHKAMLATVGAMAFTFLLVSNWHAIVQTGSGGLSQTVSGITQ